MSTVMMSTTRTVGSCHAARKPAPRLAVTEADAPRATRPMREPRPMETASPKTPPNNRPINTTILTQENNRVGMRGGFFGGVFRMLIKAGGVEPAGALEAAGVAGGFTGTGGMRGVL